MRQVDKGNVNFKRLNKINKFTTHPVEQQEFPELGHPQLLPDNDKYPHLLFQRVLYTKHFPSPGT